jgi:hypothetical protein
MEEFGREVGGVLRVFWATAYRVVFAAAGLSVVVLGALVNNKVVAWGPWVVVSIASAVGLVAFIDNLRLIYFKYQAHEREAARSRMHKPLIGALNTITEARGVPLEALGISVFAIRAKWGTLWRVIPWRVKQLRRIFRFRLSDYPPESAVKWTEGKGTIGKCWETGLPVLHDRRPVAIHHGKGNHPAPEQFSQIPAADRCGFTHSEFVRTIDKYGEILAVPITAKHTGLLVGVLSIDCLAGAYASSEMTVLRGDEIEEVAGGAAILVRDDVPKF